MLIEIVYVCMSCALRPYVLNGPMVDIRLVILYNHFNTFSWVYKCRGKNLPIYASHWLPCKVMPHPHISHKERGHEQCLCGVNHGSVELTSHEHEGALSNESTELIDTYKGERERDRGGARAPGGRGLSYTSVHLYKQHRKNLTFYRLGVHSSQITWTGLIHGLY